MAKRSGGLSQQVAADAAGISVRTAQRIDGSGRNDQAQKPEPHTLSVTWAASASA